MVNHHLTGLVGAHEDAHLGPGGVEEQLHGARAEVFPAGERGESRRGVGRERMKE